MGKQIMSDVAQVESDWGAHNFFKAGTDLADLLTLAVGPVPQTGYMNFESVDYTKAIPDFYAGYIYHFTGNDHSELLEDCMSDLPLDVLTPDFVNILTDIFNFDFIKMFRDANKFRKDLPDDFGSCDRLDELQPDLDVLDAYFDQYADQDLAPIMTRHYLTHRREVNNDFVEIQQDWIHGDYFGSGNESAVVTEILCPPKTAEETLFLF